MVIGNLERLRGLQPRFLLLIVLCVTFSAVSVVYFARFLFTPYTGLVVAYPEVVVNEGKVIFAPRAPFSPAVAAGLRPGADRVLSINGAPVSGSLDVVRAVSRIKGFAPFSVEVQRDGYPLRLDIAPAFTPSRIDWLFVFIFCLALGYTAFMLSWRQPNTPGSVPLVLAALFYLVFTCVKPFYYETLLSNSLIHLGKITSWLLVFFGLYFPRRRGTRVVRASLIATVLALYAVFFVVRILYYSAWTRTGQEGWLQSYRLLGQIGNISDAVAYVVWTALMATAYMRSSVQAERKQIQWILAGILVALPPYFFFDQLPLILGRSGIRVGLGSFAELFLSFVPIFLLIGLTRHSQFSLRVFMTRYVVYGALFLVMAAIFAVFYAPLKGFIAAGYRLPSPIAELLSTGLIFIVLAILGSIAERTMEKTFARSRDLDALERENAALRLAVEELRRQSARSFQTRRLTELRAVLRGIIRRVEGPVRRMAEGLNGRDAASAMTAGAQVHEFLRSLESLADIEAMIPGQADAETIIRRAIEKVRQRCPAARFSVVAEARARLNGYVAEIESAVGFVLENAMESLEGGGEPIVVRVRAEGQSVSIEITDAGPGLDEASRRSLFMPFVSSKAGHHGLGLYFARMLVERNDGAIEIGAGEKGGVRARLLFPREGAS
jgi:signal transduction histidine kinase